MTELGSHMNSRTRGGHRLEGLTLELNAEQVALLVDVLDSTIRDLSPEIADTDNPSFRRQLIERREQLRAIRSLLEAAGGQ
jgi:hypothetical protein